MFLIESSRRTDNFKCKTRETEILGKFLDVFRKTPKNA